MDKHTPGPWKVGKPDAEFCGSYDFPHLVLVDYGVGPCTPNVIACRLSLFDAQIVAAAPELLESLKASVAHIHDLRIVLDLCREMGMTIQLCGVTYDEARARAAIAKATEVQP